MAKVIRMRECYGGKIYTITEARKVGKERCSTTLDWIELALETEPSADLKKKEVTTRAKQEYGDGWVPGDGPWVASGFYLEDLTEHMLTLGWKSASACACTAVYQVLRKVLRGPNTTKIFTGQNTNPGPRYYFHRKFTTRDLHTRKYDKRESRAAA